MDSGSRRRNSRFRRLDNAQADASAWIFAGMDAEEE